MCKARASLGGPWILRSRLRAASRGLQAATGSLQAAAAVVVSSRSVSDLGENPRFFDQEVTYSERWGQRLWEGQGSPP